MKKEKSANLTQPEGAEEHERYRHLLFNHVPIFTTRLVKETVLSFRSRTRLTTPQDVATILTEYFEDRDREEFLVCVLDNAGTLTALSCISVGGIASSIVEPRQVFKVAILTNAASLILAHNHVSGNPEPSDADLRITRQLVEAGKIIGIAVHDHLIIVDGGYVSLAERGLL